MSTEPETSVDDKNSPTYIRTFAKDYAALSGGKTPESLPKGSPISQPKAAKTKRARKVKPIREKPVKVDESDTDQLSSEIDVRAQIQKEGVPLPTAQEKAPESFELPHIASGDIVMEAPQVVHTPPPAVEIPTTAVKDEERASEDRMAILARLKARVESQTSELTPDPSIIENAVVPAPVTPAEAAVLPPIVSSNMMPRHEELPLAVPQPPQPAPSPLHTYTSDFADRIDEKKASAFSVLAAEKDAPTKRPVAPKPNRGIGMVLAIGVGILLLIAGGGAIFAAYSYMSKNTLVQIVTGPPTLIRTDAQTKLSGSGSTLINALAATAEQPLGVDDVLLTYVDESTTTPRGVVEEQATGGAFISELGLQAPDILLRNIDPSSMVGIVHAGSETRPFFILRVTSYQRTFAGMLEWEPTMLRSLSVLYPLYPEPTPVTTTVVPASSTTPAVTKVFVPAVNPSAPSSSFVDEVVDNHSVRELKDTAGQTIVLYGYADTQTLIVCRDEAAFTLLLGKLALSNN